MPEGALCLHDGECACRSLAILYFISPLCVSLFLPLSARCVYARGRERERERSREWFKARAPKNSERREGLKTWGTAESKP